VTDSKLRELERRWKEIGSVEDEARYLLERVRVGDLEREKLELAAYCGHEAAALALTPDNPEPADVEDLLALLEQRQRLLLPLFGWSAAAEALPIWERAHPEHKAPRAVAGMLKAWLRGHGGTSKDDLVRAGRDVLRLAKGIGDPTKPTESDEAAAVAVGRAAFGPTNGRQAIQAVLEAAHALGQGDHAGVRRLTRRAIRTLLARRKSGQ